MSRIEAENQPHSIGAQIRDRVSIGLERVGSWKESLFDPEIAHTVLLPSQSNISKYMQQVGPEGVILNQGSIEIIEGLVGHPLDRGRYRQLKQLLGGERSSYQRMVKGAAVEVRLRDAVDIARLPSLAPFPEDLPKVVAVTSLDYLLSDVYLHHSFSTITIGGRQPLSLWDDQGLAYPPDDLLKDSLGALHPGDSIKFSNGGGLTMTTTILPIQEGKPIPHFMLAVEEKRANNFQSTIAEARRRDLAVLWLVKEAHLGLMEALFGQDTKDLTKRVFIQDRSGNKTTFDNKVGRFRFAREIVPGTFDSVIEYTRGELEEEWQKNIKAIKDKDSAPRYFRLLTVGIGDVSETGGSLVTFKLGKLEGKDILPALPTASTFEYNPREGLPSRANPF